MAGNDAEEAPLGFAGDVDGSISFRLSQTASSSSLGQGNTGYATSGSSSTVPVQMDLPSPPSLRDRGLVGGGVLLVGVEAGRSVVTWRAQESGLWLEERGLDDDLEGGGLHLSLQGSVSTPSAVGIFGSEDGVTDQSTMAVCAFTEDRVVHRVLLQRPATPPGEKAPSALSAMSMPHARKVARLGCRECGPGPTCWITRHLLVVGAADGSLQCVRIVEDADGQAASLSEETLRAKSGWNPLSGGGGGGVGAKAVAVTGFWHEEEKHAVVLSLHTDWSFRVWVTTRYGARRGGGLVKVVDARQLLGPSHHQHQTAAVDGSSCFLSPPTVIPGQEPCSLVVAALAAEGGLPVHMVLDLPAAGGELSKRCQFEPPGDVGPLVDAHVSDKLIVWALWARPRGSGVLGGYGGVSSCGENALYDPVPHRTIDEWLGAHEEEDGVFEELLRSKGGWSGLVSLRCPPEEGGEGGGGGGSRGLALASVELMESFYLRRMFTAGRFGRRALASAIREALPLLSDAGPLSSNSTSRQELQTLALEGVRNAAEQAFRTLDMEEGSGHPLVMSQAAQQALSHVHGLWRCLLEACAAWGRAEARPIGLAPGGAEEFATPFVVRAGRTDCLIPRASGDGTSSISAPSATSSPSPGGGAHAMSGSRDRRLSRLRNLAAQVPGLLEKALAAGAGGGVFAAAAARSGRAAEALFRSFDAESALAREGTAGGLAEAKILTRGVEGDGGYQREQMSLLKDVSEILLRSEVGARLAEAAAEVLQVDAVRDVLTWAGSLKPAKETARSRPLGHRGGVRGCSAGMATAAAFGTVKLLKERSAEARNTSVVLMLVLEQIDRLGLADQLEANIVTDALPLALKCMNQYALSAEVGSHYLRVRDGNPRVGFLGRGGGGSGAGSAQPAAVAASKPWGCTALEGLFLDSRGVVQDYWATTTEASTRRRLLGLGGLPALLAGMCEGTLGSHLKGLDSGGLLSFLVAVDQYQLALPLLGLAVDWQWRMKVELDAAVLTSIARGFLYSADAAARSEGGGCSSAGPLLDWATTWFVKASQALRASLFRDGGGGGAEVVVKHFEDALGEVERARDAARRPQRGARIVGMGATSAAVHGAGELGEAVCGGEDFGGRGAVNALELARAALAAERELQASVGGNAAGGVGLPPQQAAGQQQRQARLCQLVFKLASEALAFEEAFGVVCDNPIDQLRKENLAALAQHMCESGRLDQLCLLPFDDCPSSSTSEDDWRPWDVVHGALWQLARRSSVADLVGLAGGGQEARKRVNYYDCLYAIYIAKGDEVEAARAQDELRERLETHSAASTLPFAAAAQRARLAALNALSVAPPPTTEYGASSEAPAAAAIEVVASICPPVDERSLDATGQPAGVRTTAVLGREAVTAAAAIGLAVAAATAAPAEDEHMVGGSAATAPAAGSQLAVVASIGVSAVVETLTSTGRFEQAADVVLEGLDHRPRAMVDEMDKVVGAVARACVRAEDIARGYEIGPLPPLVRGVGPLKPRVPEAVATESSSLSADATERARSLWAVLRQLLRLDSAENSFSYHAVAVQVLLEGMPASMLPQWLEDSYLGKGQEVPDPPANANAFPPPQPGALLAPWKAFTSGRGGTGASGPNPTALLDMYVFDGRLEEACLFLCRLLDVGDVHDIGALTELVPEKNGGTDYLPYASIDRLFALSQASLERSRAAATAEKRHGIAADGLARAFETAQERLVQYFKIAKAISDMAQPNRVASAAAAGGGIWDASALMAD